MKRSGFFTNKYTISVIILITCLLTDIALHRRMSRVIIPSAFTDKRKPQTFDACTAKLLTRSKHWLKAVSSVDAMQQIPKETEGVEWDVNFDTASKNFNINIDSSYLSIDSLLAIYSERGLSAAVWLNISNLDATNSASAMNTITNIRKRYNLFDKFIIASDDPEYLKPYCDSGFFTSYNIPNFNPYSLKEDSLIHYLDTISANLKDHPVSALSGSYFQYPVLKKFFPSFSILTWTDNSNISVISRLFNVRLENDAQIKVVLYPYQ